MTTFQGIAVVTQTLRTAARDALLSAVPEARVTLDRPEETRSAQDEPRLNIYLVQVGIDPAFRNNDLPTRTDDGKVLSTPQVPVTLRYLFSYFGPTPEAHLMLGAIEVALHESPVLDPELIQRAVDQHERLQGSGLDTQRPPVRIVPAALSLETLSRFWSGFFQTPYTLSTVHDVAPVLLSSKLTRSGALPVRQVVPDAGGGMPPSPPAPPPVQPTIEPSCDGENVLVDVLPAVAAGQQVSLELDAAVAGGTSAVLETPVTQSASQLTFPLPTSPPLPPGDYLASLTVDGVRSSLEYDGERYSGPLVTVP